MKKFLYFYVEIVATRDNNIGNTRPNTVHHFVL